MEGRFLLKLGIRFRSQRRRFGEACHLAVKVLRHSSNFTVDLDRLGSGIRAALG
jgi:hypothetical protein